MAPSNLARHLGNTLRITTDRGVFVGTLDHVTPQADPTWAGILLSGHLHLIGPDDTIEVVG